MHLQSGPTKLGILVISLGIVLGAVMFPDDAAAQSIMIVVDGGDAEESIWARAERFLTAAKKEVLPKDEAEILVPAAEVKKCVSRKGNRQQSCMKTHIQTATVERVLYLEVDTGRKLLVARLYASSGVQERTEQRKCGGCGKPDIGPLVDELVGRLFDIEVKGGGTGKATVKTWIHVQTDPPQAKVRIDGARFGPSGRYYRVTPGPHTVSAELEGYENGQATVDATADKTTSVRIRLTKKESLVYPPGCGRWKWLTLAGGVSLVVVGGIGIWIDGPRQDGNMRLPERWYTMPGGIASASVGVVLLGVSGYMFYRDSKRRPIKRRVVLQPVVYGLGVGFAGMF